MDSGTVPLPPPKAPPVMPVGACRRGVRLRQWHNQCLQC